MVRYEKAARLSIVFHDYGSLLQTTAVQAEAIVVDVLLGRHNVELVVPFPDR